MDNSSNYVDIRLRGISMVMVRCGCGKNTNVSIAQARILRLKNKKLEIVCRNCGFKEIVKYYKNQLKWGYEEYIGDVLVDWKNP